ncbi:MAG: ASKHA domain-containing protein [Syntrophobacterales bacterium]|jgi:uncharacterized 2Fe-2S/4Fe-4S cluster protein (DUF4445 family)|nr:ASKHA domain-containing protein [Syntrophobacterales bacterium]
MAEYRVKFFPMETMFSAAESDNLLDVAMRSGVHINASCGGNGTCGKCRIMLREGDVNSPSHRTITPEDYGNGVRLACMTAIHGDIAVEVPLESQVDRTALGRRREAPHILSPSDAGKLVAGMEIDPAVFKRYIKLPEPTMEDNISDLARLTRELRTQCGIHVPYVDFLVLKKLAKVLRAGKWKVTVTIATTGSSYTLINVEQGNREFENYSIVLDIGTTTICGQLLDLANCGVTSIMERLKSERDLCTLSEHSDYNKQISFGEDVISRIVFSGKKDGLCKLQEAVVDAINQVIDELVASAGIMADSISHVVFAGNTTMTHLLLGLDPTYIMRAPYIPTTTFFPPIRVTSLGVKLGDHVHAFTFPSVASYVGGDIIAGVLGSGMFQRSETTLFLDIGTNGEIVLGNKDWLTCASCSAGPAFEGGGIEFGMRAGKGAIEQVRINPSTYEPMILTVGKSKPVGICGSGLIDVVAELLETGLIDQKGTFDRNGKSGRVRAGANGHEYVLSYGPDTGTGRDIVITESDIDNLIRTKAAIYAGCKVLLDSLGVSVSEIDTVIIAGGFGHYIDLEKAITIGLFPELPLRKFIFVGNSVLLGVRLASFSSEFLKEVNEVTRKMTNVELSANPRFMEEFVASMFLPHTDERVFPKVMERLMGTRKNAE